MDDDPLTPDDRTWLANLLAETGPEATHEIAELLGIDLGGNGED